MSDAHQSAEPRAPGAERQSLTATHPFTAVLIRCVAGRLSSYPPFGRSDQPDLEQELRLKLLVSEPSFDPGQGPWEPYATAVVERHAITLVRDQHAEKRTRRRTVSLHVEVDLGGGGTAELVHTVSQREQDRRRLTQSLSDEEQTQQRLDVATVFETLSPEQRKLVELLKVDSVTGIARQSGTPPSTLRSRVKQLRRPFKDCRKDS